MNRLAITFAVVGFFVLAGAASLGGCAVYTCALRGVIGAAVIFVATRLGFKVLVSVIADAMSRPATSRERPNERSDQ